MVTALPESVRAAWLIPAFPMLGALVLLFFGKRLKRASGPIATLMLTASFVTAAKVFFDLVARPESSRTFTRSLFTWITAGSFKVQFDYRIDPLSIVMILVVTGVGALIHLYSVGYMKGDEREGRYFAYLNLFAASMLILVLANNFLILYLGWELVGMCSYLLIGFWFDRPGVASAAKKAFITNRVGDFAFAIGLFLIFTHFHSLDFDTVFRAAPALAGTTAVIAAIPLLLFAGATGKSAQIPLYVWLPDAMAGPTPVSALIHAATMVTAGVYMVARTHVFFDLSHTAQVVVSDIGLATALLAGVIAVAQDDIKKVLAYSTVSQLGFMFMAVGIGSYPAGIFHLVTHAFFKALLFLGAGSVMHAMGDRTDITKFGGLARKIPWTAFTFILGWLAIIGFPGFSGFYSKDQILEGAYHWYQPFWLFALAATALTGFYMTRLVTLTFFGKSRDDSGHHPHESPVSMVFPLVALGAAAVFGGFLINADFFDGRLARFLTATPSSGVIQTVHPGGGSLSAGTLSLIATAAGLGGALVALVMYLGAFDWRRRRENPGPIYKLARNKFFVDDVYQFLFTGVGKVAATTLAYVVDLKIVDGIVNGAGTVTARIAAGARRAQTGYVRSYALGVLAGTVGLLAFLVGRQIH
jgi:NADH-quinone oxidoreductase subunit L